MRLANFLKKNKRNYTLIREFQVTTKKCGFLIQELTVKISKRGIIFGRSRKKNIPISI